MVSFPLGTRPSFVAAKANKVQSHFAARCGGMRLSYILSSAAHNAEAISFTCCAASGKPKLPFTAKPVEDIHPAFGAAIYNKTSGAPRST